MYFSVSDWFRCPFCFHHPIMRVTWFSRLGQLNTGNSFSGCISNVRLSNNVTGGMDSVSLNDARLLQYFKGATFDGCLAQVCNTRVPFKNALDFGSYGIMTNTRCHFGSLRAWQFIWSCILVGSCFQPSYIEMHVGNCFSLFYQISKHLHDSSRQLLYVNGTYCRAFQGFTN